MYVKGMNFTGPTTKCRYRRTVDIAENDIGEFYCGKHEMHKAMKCFYVVCTCLTRQESRYLEELKSWSVTAIISLLCADSAACCGRKWYWGNLISKKPKQFFLWAVQLKVLLGWVVLHFCVEKAANCFCLLVFSLLTWTACIAQKCFADAGIGTLPQSLHCMRLASIWENSPVTGEPRKLNKVCFPTIPCVNALYEHEMGNLNKLS